MKKYFSIFLLLVLTATCYCQEMKMSPKALPPAVLQAFRSAYPNARIKGATKEINNGETSYEISCKDNTARRDIHYSADGKLLEAEELITVDRLPEAVTTAITKQYAKGKIMSIEMAVKDSKTEYEVLIKDKKKKFEVVFSPDGSVVSTK